MKHISAIHCTYKDAGRAIQLYVLIFECRVAYAIWHLGNVALRIVWRVHFPVPIRLLVRKVEQIELLRKHRFPAFASTFFFLYFSLTFSFFLLIIFFFIYYYFLSLSYFIFQDFMWLIFVIFFFNQSKWRPIDSANILADIIAMIRYVNGTTKNRDPNKKNKKQWIKT